MNLIDFVKGMTVLDALLLVWIFLYDPSSEMLLMFAAVLIVLYCILLPFAKRAEKRELAKLIAEQIEQEDKNTREQNARWGRERQQQALRDAAWNLENHLKKDGYRIASNDEAGKYHDLSYLR